MCYGMKQLGQLLSKQHLSHWLVEAVSHSYSSQGFPFPEGLVAHSTRSMATSWEALWGVAVGYICTAVSCSTPCVFARFYRVNVTSVAITTTFPMTASEQFGELPCSSRQYWYESSCVKTIVAVRSEIKIYRCYVHNYGSMTPNDDCQHLLLLEMG